VPESLANNLPALIVTLPLAAALLCAVFGRRGRAWWITAGTTAAVLGGSLVLLARVLAAPGMRIDYTMSGWPPPFGIVLSIDPLNAWVLVIVASIAAVVTVFARCSVPSEIPSGRLSHFYAIWLLAITGLLGITITGDAFNLYVLLEISSLATYVLVAMGKFRDRRALGASVQYLILGTIGASFILIGIGFLYAITGTLNMSDMARSLSEIYATWGTDDSRHVRAAITGFAFLMTGVSIKLALFPLHLWLPNAYTWAPSAVSGLLAATATKVGAYIAIRFLFTVVGTELSFDLETGLRSIFLVASSLAVLVGSWAAIRQRNLKRLLAYSSVAQIGYIAMGFSLGNVDGLTGSIVHLFNHAVIKGGMFLALGIVAYRVGGVSIDHVRGLGRRMPVTLGAFTVGGLGLIGVPLTTGFVSKWYLVAGAIEAGRPLLAVVVLFGSVLALFYTWRAVEAIWFGEPTLPAEKLATLREGPKTMLAPTLVLVLASVVFGILARDTVHVARTAATDLLDGRFSAVEAPAAEGAR